MKDITDRKDIEKLVNKFYAKVRKDPTIGYIFNDVANINWEHHLPRIADFWEAVLFRETLFDGNPLQKHIEVDEKEELQKKHFERWLELFHETLGELFEGPKADEAKMRSKNIAGVFQYHLNKHRSPSGFRIDPLA